MPPFKFTNYFLLKREKGKPAKIKEKKKKKIRWELTLFEPKDLHVFGL